MSIINSNNENKKYNFNNFFLNIANYDESLDWLKYNRTNIIKKIHTETIINKIFIRFFNNVDIFINYIVNYIIPNSKIITNKINILIKLVHKYQLYDEYGKYENIYNNDIIFKSYMKAKKILKNMRDTIIKDMLYVYDLYFIIIYDINIIKKYFKKKL